MKVLSSVDYNYVVDAKWLWQVDDSVEDGAADIFDIPDRVNLIFGIFYLDKFNKDNSSHIRRIKDRLDNTLIPWNKNYPWTEYTGITTRIETLQDGSQYILGQLCVEDNIQEEEGLLVGILQEFSRHLESTVFIKICDTDGDFILAECHDVLPKEYEYPIANNRMWLHQGRFELIPNNYIPSKGLNQREALTFLANSYFKLIEIEPMSERIRQGFLFGFPSIRLGNLRTLNFTVDSEKEYNIFRENPKVVSFLIKHLPYEDMVINEDSLSVAQFTGDLNVLVASGCEEVLSFLLENQSVGPDDKGVPRLVGKALSLMLQHLMDENVLKLIPDEAISRKSRSNPTTICPVDRLFKDYTFKRVNYARSDDNKGKKDPTEQLINVFRKMFEGRKFLDTEDEGFEETAFGTEDDSLPENSEVDGDPDIDEDDFFEYFLQEALHIDKEEMDRMRSEYFK